MDAVKIFRDKRLEKEVRDEPCFRCNKLGHTTDESKVYSSFHTDSGYSFDRVSRDRDVLASDYEVPGPGSYDVNLSSFSFINKHKNDDKKLTRRGSDSHIVHDNNCDERLWNERAVEESSFWMTFQIANMPPYFRHAIEMWFQDSWQNIERRKVKRHFRAWRKIYRVSKMKRKEEMERRLKRASIRMRKKIEEARKKKIERKQSILQQKHHNSKMASLYRAFQGTRSMLGGLDDYQNETIIRKSSELLECLKRTIVVSDDCSSSRSSGEHINNKSGHEKYSSLPVDVKRKSQKELDEMFHDRVDALVESRNNRDKELLRDIKDSVRRSRFDKFESEARGPSKSISSKDSQHCKISSVGRSSNVSFDYLVGLLNK